ncbi:MAG TPA: tetratricopeptide repeat protein [Kofleriaceae bacterium]
MTVRHIVLAAAAVLVIGLGVKLFYEVRANPTVEPAGPAAPQPDSRPRKTEPPRPGAGIRRDPEPTNPARADDAATPTPQTPAQVEEAMKEASQAYDRQDYDEAKELANRLLAQDPNNVKMRRILVSSACMQGDPGEAQKHFDLLPTSGDARQVMRVRCKREGIVFTETATGPGFQPARTP